MRHLSSLMWVSALSLTVAAAAARGQTVIVTNAPAGSTIELTLNSVAITSATADASGDATLAAGLPPGVEQSDVRFVVDSCGTLLRVQLVNPGASPRSTAAGCTRTEIRDLFVMRRVTTFVIDVMGSAVSVHLRQGPAPREWLTHGELRGPTGKYFRSPPQTGLVLFAAAGLSTFSKAKATACGDVTACAGGGAASAGAAGAAYWITRSFGGQITFARPATASASGSGGTFRFSSALDSRLVTVAGLAGVPVGAMRLYALAGANRHRAELVTTETIDDVSVVVDDATRTITGGTQRFAHNTEGWSWLVGGGLEAWPTKSLAFYVEVQSARLDAPDIGAVEGRIDDRVLAMVAGVRVRLGR
jgi:hypothetical protein